MKPAGCFCFLILLFSTVDGFAQIAFPKGFRLVKGEALSGEEDSYTDGRYTFQVFRTGWLEADSDLKKTYGYHQTKDSLYWSTGKSEGRYFYKVYNGELVQVCSRYNDSGFSAYSKWLLSTMRKYHHSSVLLFPPREN